MFVAFDLFFIDCFNSCMTNYTISGEYELEKHCIKSRFPRIYKTLYLLGVLTSAHYLYVISLI